MSSRANPIITTKIRTFEIVQYVNGYLPGNIDDWPANVQDTILAALERKANEIELPLKIVNSYCDEDIDVLPGLGRRYFIHVVASEIVTGINIHPESLQ